MGRNGQSSFRFEVFANFVHLFVFQLNCEELVEGYENPVAGVTRSADKDDGAAAGDDSDEDDDNDGGTSSKKKKTKAPSSSQSISILSRTTSEFETCSAEKAVDFDPVQGIRFLPRFFSISLASSSIAFYRYAMLLLRKSEGEQRLSNQSESNEFNDVRHETTDLLYEEKHKRRR